MNRVLLAVFIGLFAGCLFGSGAAVGILKFTNPAAAGWTSYPTLGSVVSGPVVQSSFWEYSTFYFWGILYGGGFGSVTGAIVGASREIVDAIKNARPAAPVAVNPHQGDKI